MSTKVSITISVDYNLPCSLRRSYYTFLDGSINPNKPIMTILCPELAIELTKRLIEVTAFARTDYYKWGQNKIK